MLTCRQSQHTTLKAAQAVLRKGDAQAVLRAIRQLNQSNYDALSAWCLAVRKTPSMPASQQDMLRGCGCAFLMLQAKEASQQEAVMIATITQTRKGGCACRCQPATKAAQGGIDGVAS